MDFIPSSGFSIESLLRGLTGIVALLGLAYLFSGDRKNIPWKTVSIALATQIFLGIGILKISFIQKGFEMVGNVFIKVIEYTLAGSAFMFDRLTNVEEIGYVFAFQVLPVIVFFSALTSILYYLGLIQRVVGFLAWALRKIVRISGAESLSLTGNIFLGQTEAPLLIKPYLDKMSRSEIYVVMVGGMATVAGSVLAAYVGFLSSDNPSERLAITQHLIAASVMAAPGAVAISKIIVPNKTDTTQQDYNISRSEFGENFLSAITNGTTQGIRLAVNVGAMLLVFVALLALANDLLGGLGEMLNLNALIAENTAYKELSIDFILGYAFAPLMWIIGIAKEDMAAIGQLLGIKLAANEFVAFTQLAELKRLGGEVQLTYQKSITMATFMLCGFANFSSIGIQLGGIGELAPNQRKTLSELGIKAVIGGTLVSLLSATIAGMLLG